MTLIIPSMRRVYEHYRYNVSSNGCLLACREMAGRNDHAIVDVMAHVMGQEK